MKEWRFLVVRSGKWVGVLELTVEGSVTKKNSKNELTNRLKQETPLAFDKIEIIENLEEVLRMIDKWEEMTP